MLRRCSECTRINPTEAAFCWFDGIPLDGSAAVPGEGSSINFGVLAFPTPFVFPSGTTCRNFLQLALACRRNVQEACEILQGGFFESFFGVLGRMDLALTARNAAKNTDRERGLDDLLGKLPGSPLEPPVLHVEPAQHDLGIVPFGEERHFDLTLTNKKDRLLCGKVSVDSCPWLVLGDSGASEKLFQFFDTMTLPVRVLGNRLRAYAKPQKAEIVLESNGGNVTVAVQIIVPVKPFPEGVLSGAMSPRQVAEKAKAHAKEAAVLIESGAVARWYESNGWAYPVQGPTASGIAAVQQLFEVLGLVKTPKVEVSEPAITLRGKPGQRLEYVITVLTREKRAAVAHGISDQPWLTINKTIFRGQTASIPLTVAAVPDQPGYALTACVKVTANGNQRFDVPVTLNIGDGPYVRAPVQSSIPTPAPEQSSIATVATDMPVMPPPTRAPEPAPTPVPVPASPPAPVVAEVAEVVAVEAAPVVALAEEAPTPVAVAEPAATAVPVAAFAAVAPTSVASPPSGGGFLGRLFRRLLPLGIVFIGLLIAVVRDLIPGESPPKELPPVDYANPVLGLKFHETRQEPEYVMPVPSMRFGIGVPDPKDPKKFLTKLTYDDFGRTSNVCVRVDRNVDYLWGLEGGAWKLPAKQELGKDAEGHPQIGAKSEWVLNNPPISITQWVKLVPGGLSADSSKRLLDTCLIRYDISNNDAAAHVVGLRFMLDTFIGSNDGVPFTIANSKELCNTMKEFNSPNDVPDFISALEREDLKNPGTVAHISLRYADGIEPPTRVTLGAWPASKLRELTHQNDARMQDTRWSVPVLPMAAAKSDDPHSPNAKGDSAVTLYWDEKELPAKTTRTVGFAYGLGTVTGEKGAGQLGLTTGGEQVKGKEFTLTAYVQNPASGAKVTLKLPSDLKLTSGKETEDVPQPGAASSYSTVTWRVKADKAGVFQVHLSLNSGAKMQANVLVQQQAENIR